MEKMAVAAEAYGMSAPQFNFLNGDPDEVNRVLDRLQVARMANEKTGEIDHANLFFLIDRSGTIAYRFNLSERHEEWLVQALRSLVEETAPEVDPVHAAGSTVERMSGG
jgi:protein SCO1